VSATDYRELSMLELFKLEAETQTQVLTDALLVLEHDATSPATLEACMRASHSLKGAARIVGLNPGVSVTHAMEDCFVAAQNGRLTLAKPQIDLLLRGVDLITKVANASDADLVAFAERDPPEVDSFVGELEALLAQPAAEAALDDAPAPSVRGGDAAAPAAGADAGERALRVSAQNFNRLLGLSAQSLVESRWLGPFHAALLRLKRQQDESVRALEALAEALPRASLDERAERAIDEARASWRSCRATLGERIEELDRYEARVTSTARRLHDEALTCRMRPFSDGVVAFPRLVRDVAQSLGKRARLEIAGEATAVDRDVLASLEGPLIHLLRNAVDHGIDPPEVRRAAGKPEAGSIRIEARHLAGLLEISVSDDGHGIDVERVRSAIVSRGLIDAQTAQRLGDSEVYEFLFLPGFTLREEVTEISGRGVGLDVVQSTLKRLRGSVRLSSRLGQGTVFQLFLPLTVSVVRALIADIGGEPYAFPLAHIERTLSLAAGEIHTLEGRQHFSQTGRQIGLVLAHQLLGVGDREPCAERLPVLVLGDGQQSYGLVVDALRGVRELVVQPLDARLGKIKDIAAGALLDDGTPVLIADMDDLVRSIEKLVSGGHLNKVQGSEEPGRRVARKRVLVVDDSFTVRELERKLIDGRGYDVEVAVDGMDGWNALRGGAFDLVVTDIDMPRMDGIDLDAGADYYLTKSSFKNEGLLQAVFDLIGGPSA
jgi:two-component system, chemotaxis family, sensor histidine kinase and response regulator WspE